VPGSKTMHRRRMPNFGTLLLLGLTFSVASFLTTAEVVETLLDERIEKEILVIDGTTIYFTDKTSLPLDMLKTVSIDVTQSPAEQELQHQRIETIYKRVDLFDVERGYDGHRLQNLLLDRRYEELEKNLDQSLRSRAQYGDGYWHLPTHYGFLKAEESRGLASTVLNRAREWITRKPESVHARALYLQLKLRLVWSIRGSGLSHTVSDQRRSAYRPHLNDAAKISAEIDAIPHTNPAAFEPQIKLAMINSNQKHVLELVDQASSIEPMYWPVYTTAVPAMLKRWGASSADFQALLALMDKNTPDSFRDAFYYRIAATLFRLGAIEYLRGNFDWSRVKRGFSDIEKRFKLSDAWQHRMATIAFVERDMSAMQGYFEQSYANGSPTKNSVEVWRSDINLIRAKEQLFMHNLQPKATTYNRALRAIATNDPSLLAHSIGPKFDANATDHVGNTLLHSAVAVRSEILVGMLLEAKANPNIQDGYGRTPLHDAAALGSSVLVQQLLSAGADPLMKNNSGSTPLLLAAPVRNVFLLNVLITAAPSSVNIANENGFTPLIMSARNNNQALAKLLLTQPDIALNSTDKYGYTALHRAVVHADGEIAELLLNADADHGLKSAEGLSVVGMAKATGREGLLPMLREYGAIE